MFTICQGETQLRSHAPAESQRLRIDVYAHCLNAIQLKSHEDLPYTAANIQHSPSRTRNWRHKPSLVDRIASNLQLAQVSGYNRVRSNFGQRLDSPGFSVYAKQLADHIDAIHFESGVLNHFHGFFPFEEVARAPPDIL